jgi:hypothetical protein
VLAGPTLDRAGENKVPDPSPARERPGVLIKPEARVLAHQDGGVPQVQQRHPVPWGGGRPRTGGAVIWANKIWLAPCKHPLFKREEHEEHHPILDVGLLPSSVGHRATENRDTKFTSW